MLAGGALMKRDVKKGGWVGRKKKRSLVYLVFFMLKVEQLEGIEVGCKQNSAGGTRLDINAAIRSAQSAGEMRNTEIGK